MKLIMTIFIFLTSNITFAQENDVVRNWMLNVQGEHKLYASDGSAYCDNVKISKDSSNPDRYIINLNDLESVYISPLMTKSDREWTDVSKNSLKYSYVSYTGVFQEKKFKKTVELKLNSNGDLDKVEIKTSESKGLLLRLKKKNILKVECRS